MAEERIVPMRLQRFLARAGVASRRGSERLMTSGRVTVNGQVVSELGSKVDPLVDVVAVDGVVCSIAEKPVYLMLNKPAGYLTTMKDPQGRPTIVDMVPTDRYPGLFPVGRLDMDTTGLLFFTTDGQMAQELLHPSKHVWKHYVAHVVGTPTEEQINRLREGIELEDGPAAPAEVEIVSNDAKMKALLAPQGLGKTGGGEPNSLVSVTIREGRKHQVKKMLLAIHHRVLALHRDTFGPLHLTGVKEGEWRLLTEEEVAALERTIGREPGASPIMPLHASK